MVASGFRGLCPRPFGSSPALASSGSVTSQTDIHQAVLSHTTVPEGMRLAMIVHERTYGNFWIFDGFVLAASPDSTGLSTRRCATLWPSPRSRQRLLRGNQTARRRHCSVAAGRFVTGPASGSPGETAQSHARALDGLRRSDPDAVSATPHLPLTRSACCCSDQY